MAFSFKDQFATYWGTEEEKEKYARVKITTGDKQQNGDWINTNWFATFVGKAFDKLDQLESKDRIKVTGKISNPYNKEKKQAYLNVLVWDFSFLDENKNSESSEDEALPFD